MVFLLVLKTQCRQWHGHTKLPYIEPIHWSVEIRELPILSGSGCARFQTEVFHIAYHVISFQNGGDRN